MVEFGSMRASDGIDGRGTLTIKGRRPVWSGTKWPGAPFVVSSEEEFWFRVSWFAERLHGELQGEVVP